MYIVTIVLFIALFFTYLEDKNIFKNGMLFGMWVISIFFSLRYGYGNDFYNYERIFYNITNDFSLLKLKSGQYNVEPGWVFFCYIFKHAGFQFLLFAQLLLVNGIIYKCIKKYVPRGYYTYAIFFYLFNSTLFLLNLSMLRQGTAGVLALFSLICVLERKNIFQSLLLLLLANSIHTSSIIMYPFLLFFYFKDYINIKYLLWALIPFSFVLYQGYISLTVFYDLILDSDDLSDIYGNYLSKDTGGLTFGLGFLLQILAMIPCIYQFTHKSKITQIFCVSYLMMFVFNILGAEISIISRLSQYFTLYSLLLFPRIYHNNENRLLCNMSKLCMIVYTLYAYFAFFYSPTYGAYYRTFKFCF